MVIQLTKDEFAAVEQVSKGRMKRPGLSTPNFDAGLLLLPDMQLIAFIEGEFQITLIGQRVLKQILGGHDAHRRPMGHHLAIRG